MLWLLGHHMSIASAVGFIALAGVAAEFGVVMLLYLRHAWASRIERGETSEADLVAAIHEGAVLRVRPKAMTVAVIVAGLLPIMFGSGSGSEVMQRIAATDGGRDDYRAVAHHDRRAGSFLADGP